jgi:oligoribonuclease NrnB/cAMP/cGMP phosphodiesterase (DHH superfamily)
MRGPRKTVILYHANCPDGLGGAYAAWKKFGEHAEYIPVRHGRPAPEGLRGARLFFIDFCYPRDIMDGLQKEAESLVVLDHHEGIRDVVESMPEHVYDDEHSGAVIAWKYFHPDKSVPLMLRYVEDGDLYKFTLVDSRPLLAYLYSKPFELSVWDDLIKQVENEKARADMVERGKIYAEYGELLVEELVSRAQLVSFEGHEIYLSTSIGAFTSDLGNKLARRKGPLALCLEARPDGLRVSLRGDGSVDVSEIARTYGGNGHRNAAAFSLPYEHPVPWKELEEPTP